MAYLRAVLIVLTLLLFLSSPLQVARCAGVGRCGCGSRSPLADAAACTPRVFAKHARRHVASSYRRKSCFVARHSGAAVSSPSASSPSEVERGRSSRFPRGCKKPSCGSPTAADDPAANAARRSECSRAAPAAFPRDRRRPAAQVSRSHFAAARDLLMASGIETVCVQPVAIRYFIARGGMARDATCFRTLVAPQGRADPVRSRVWQAARLRAGRKPQGDSRRGRIGDCRHTRVHGTSGRPARASRNAGPRSHRGESLTHFSGIMAPLPHG